MGGDQNHRGPKMPSGMGLGWGSLRAGHQAFPFRPLEKLGLVLPWRPM